MAKALIVVDVQRDFLPGGPLAVPDGNAVVKPLRNQMPHYDLVVFTQDWHPSHHFSFRGKPEFKDGSWPKHCVAKSRGAEIDTRLITAALGTPTFFVEKGQNPEREDYSGFQGIVHKCVLRSGFRNVAEARKYEGLDLGSALDRFRTMNLVTGKIEKIIYVTVGGLALDYCVKATALDAESRGYGVTVDLDATRAVNKGSGWQAIEEFHERHMNLLGSPSHGVMTP